MPPVALSPAPGKAAQRWPLKMSELLASLRKGPLSPSSPEPSLIWGVTLVTGAVGSQTCESCPYPQEVFPPPSWCSNERTHSPVLCSPDLLCRPQLFWPWFFPELWWFLSSQVRGQPPAEFLESLKPKHAYLAQESLPHPGRTQSVHMAVYPGSPGWQGGRE